MANQNNPTTHVEPHTAHPAHIDEFMKALRTTDEGGGVAESLEIIFDNAPPFQLTPTPLDEWDYVRDIVRLFVEEDDLAARSLADRQHAFVVGVEIGFALALHPR